MLGLSEMERKVVREMRREPDLLLTQLGILKPLASAMEKLGVGHISYASIKKIYQFLGVNEH